MHCDEFVVDMIGKSKINNKFIFEGLIINNLCIVAYFVILFNAVEIEESYNKQSSQYFVDISNNVPEMAEFESYISSSFVQGKV